MNINIDFSNVVKYSTNPGRNITWYEPINEKATTLKDVDLKSTIFKVSSEETFEKYKDILNKIDEEMMQIKRITELSSKELLIVYQNKSGEIVSYSCSNTSSNRNYYHNVKEKQTKTIDKRTKENLDNKSKKNRNIAIFLAAAVALGAYCLGNLTKNKEKTSSTTSITQTGAILPEITFKPTQVPTAMPTQAPTAMPTQAPTAMPTQAPTAMPTQVPTAMPTQVPTAMPTQAPTAMPTQAPTAMPTQAPTAIPTQAHILSNYNKFYDSYKEIVPEEEKRNISNEDLNIAYELINSRYGIIRNSLNPNEEIKVVHIVDSYIQASLLRESDKYLLSNIIEDESRRQELRTLEDGLRQAVKGKGDSKIFGKTVKILTEQGFYNNEDFASCVDGFRNLDMNTFASDEDFEKYLGLVLNDEFFTFNNFLQISTLGASIGDPKIFNDNQDTMESFIVLRNKSRQIVSELILMTPEEKGKIK